jgi:hypothetical protein
MHTDIHASSGIRTHDPSVRACKDGSSPSPRGHCDRPLSDYTAEQTVIQQVTIRPRAQLTTEIVLYLHNR